MTGMIIFYELRDSSTSFSPILLKPSHHTIHKVYFQEHNSQNLKEYTMQYRVQPGRNTKNEVHAHLLGIS